MAVDASSRPDSSLINLRRRGQFLIAILLWAAVGGFVVVTSAYALVVYHDAISIAERTRLGLGFAVPVHGPDWFLLFALLAGPAAGLLGFMLLVHWYKPLWLRRIAVVWPDGRQRRQLSKWLPAPVADTRFNDATHEWKLGFISARLR